MIDQSDSMLIYLKVPNTPRHSSKSGECGYLHIRTGFHSNPGSLKGRVISTVTRSNLPTSTNTNSHQFVWEQTIINHANDYRMTIPRHDNYAFQPQDSRLQLVLISPISSGSAHSLAPLPKIVSRRGSVK